MTDTSNRHHRNTLPVGGMKPTVWQEYVALAQLDMCAPFAELVTLTSQPFVTTIGDSTCPRPSALGGKVLIVGEALNLMRPHMALSTTQSAVQALLLGRALRYGNPAGLQQWEREVLQYARICTLKTNAFGTFFLYGYTSAAAWVLWLCIVILCGFWPLSLVWDSAAEKKCSTKNHVQGVGGSEG